jgi:hypothetical protein
MSTMGAARAGLLAWRKPKQTATYSSSGHEARGNRPREAGRAERGDAVSRPPEDGVPPEDRAPGRGRTIGEGRRVGPRSGRAAGEGTGGDRDSGISGKKEDEEEEGMDF